MEIPMNRIAAKKRVLLAVAFMAIVVLVWYKFLFLKQQAGLASLRAEMERVETDVTGWMAETKSLSDYQKEYQALKENHWRFLSRIPEKDQVQELAEEIIEMGRTYDCRVTYVGVPVSRFFGEGDPSESGEVMIIPLMLIIRGDFIPVGEFMGSMSRLSYFASFGEIEMSRSDRMGAEELETNLWMNIYVKRDSLKG